MNPVPTAANAEREGHEPYTLLFPNVSVERLPTLVEAAQRIQALRGGRAVAVRPARAVIGDGPEFETFNVFFGGEPDWTVALSLPHARQDDLFSALRAAASLKAAA